MSSIKFLLVTVFILYDNPVVTGRNATIVSDLKTRCVYARKFDLRSKTEAEECCQYTAEEYARYQWATGGRYLTNFMENLKAWNCTQFYEECADPTYDFTDFTKMVYTYFCTYDSFQSDCLTDVETALGVQINPNQNWTDALKLMNPSLLSDEEILNPCTQLAVYEHGALGERYDYSEIIQTAIPTCGWIWQGFHSNTIQGRKITPWQLASVG